MIYCMITRELHQVSSAELKKTSLRYLACFSVAVFSFLIENKVLKLTLAECSKLSLRHLCYLTSVSSSVQQLLTALLAPSDICIDWGSVFFSLPHLAPTCFSQYAFVESLFWLLIRQFSPTVSRPAALANHCSLQDQLASNHILHWKNHSVLMWRHPQWQERWATTCSGLDHLQVMCW